MSQDFELARQNMVESQVRTADVTDPYIQAAMRAVPRESYCGPNRHLAYAEGEVPYAPGYALLQPRDVAKLLQAVRGRPGERALAVHAPYAGAVLAAIGLAVDQHEASGPIEGYYDVIVSEGAVAEAPQAWKDALAPGGRLCVIERRDRVGRATLYLRSADGVGSRIVFDAFAPHLPGFEPQPSFAL